MAEEEKKKEWPKLDPVFKMQWIAALRSGEYEQVQGTLCKRVKKQGTLYGQLEDVVGYCCLGLAGHVVGISDDAMYSYTAITSTIKSNNDELINYPKQLTLVHVGQESLSFDKELPRQLAGMNDGVGTDFKDEPIKPHSFSEIADWIEENL